MKRIWFLIALVTCFFKSNAQTTVPFYGFELSNYEVGDTLEYANTNFVIGSGSGCSGKQVFTVIGKQQTTPETIVYTFRIVHQGYCSGAPVGTEGIDTVSISIANDTVLNNGNNVLQLTLPGIDSLSTGNLSFDTVAGLKHIQASIQGFEWLHEYEAKQNLGVISRSRTVPPPAPSYTYELVYANLQNYGVYGSYEPVILDANVIDPERPVSVAYDEANKIIRLVSNQHHDGKLNLYDLIGRRVLTTDVYRSEISVGILSRGVYVYQVTGHQPSSGKLWIR